MIQREEGGGVKTVKMIVYRIVVVVFVYLLACSSHCRYTCQIHQ